MGGTLEIDVCDSISDSIYSNNLYREISVKNLSLCRYMAPEIVKGFSNKSLSSKYPWGISMAEYLLVERAFKNLDASEFQQQVLNGETRPDIDKLKKEAIGGVDQKVLDALRLSWKKRITR